MENERSLNYKRNNAKYNELNNLISSYFKSELENEENFDKAIGDISKMKYKYKNFGKINNRKINNSNSPSFGCERAKSFDDINYDKLKNANPNNNNNNYNYKITYYKKPRHYINNKSSDNIKNKHNNNRYNNNSNQNYNTNNYNTTPDTKEISPLNKSRNMDSYPHRTSNNTIFSKINSNDEFFQRDSSNLDKNNSFNNNIFTKIPTNISRIKKKNYDTLDQSSDNSLYNNVNNITNYRTINSQNNNNYINNKYLTTFYIQKDLSVEMPKNDINNNNEKPINDSMINNDKEKVNKKVYNKTPIPYRRNVYNKRYIRKKSDDYYTYSRNTNNDLLNLEKKRKEDYYKNHTTCANTINNNNNINNNKKYNKRLNDNNKYQKILTPKVNRYKDYYYVYNIQNNMDSNINNNISNNTYLANNDYINKKIKNNLVKIDNKSLKHRKLSSYIIKDRKYATKSYDNSVFKAKIKLIKKKKRPKRIRYKTFDDTPIDKPSATPIKKEKDKGGKIDLFDKKFNSLNKNNKSYSKEFNHQININIKNIKINLQKIILIQKWWKSILQKKIISFNEKFNQYKKNKEKSIPKNNKKININSQKRYLDKNKYNTCDLNNNIKKINVKNYIKENINEEIIKKKIIQNKYYVTKSYYKNVNSYIILLQKYIRDKLLKNKNKVQKFEINKLIECSVNKIYLPKEIKNKINHYETKKINNKNEEINSMPLLNNCFISKMYNIKKPKQNQKNNNLKIIKESKNEYLTILPKKSKKEIENNITKEILLNIKKNNIEPNIKNNINNEDNIKIPKNNICNISKINYIKYSNKIIKYPLIKKCEFISKINKSNSKIKSIIFLQKNIINYIKNKNNKIQLNSFTKPYLLKCCITKIYKTNISYDIQKIKYIQKKFKEYQYNNNNINNSNLLINEILQNKEYKTRNIKNYKNNMNNDIKSLSSNDNTSQRSKKSNENKNQNVINKDNSTGDIFKNNINNKQQLCDLIQMIIQKISKNINQFVFYTIKKEKKNKNKNIFFFIIKKIINIYNNISKNKNKNDYNEFLKLINDNLSKNINDLNKYNYISFIPKKEENNLINTQLYQSKNKDKLLLNFICAYLKIEHNLIINNNTNNLIEYRLIKEPLKDHNIFTIIRYLDMLYDDILNKNICNNCFCKSREKCEIGCSCHHSDNFKNKSKQKSKISDIQKRKIKTHSLVLSYSFDDINNNNNLYNNKNDDIEIISNVLLYDKIFKRNIYYSINKVDKLNNSMSDSISEIDVFQKMNEGTQSLIKKEMINKIFDEYKKDKYNNIMNNTMNIFGGEDNQNCQKIRHVSKLSSSEIGNISEEDDSMLNKIKNYFEEKK